MNALLDALLDALAEADWSAFPATAAATVTGVLIGLLGTALLAWWDRRERYSSRLDDALAQVLKLGVEYAEARANRTDPERVFQRGLLATVRGLPPEPSMVPLRGALDVVRAVARRRDRPVADALALAVLHSADQGTFESTARAVLQEYIVQWRQGGPTRKVLRTIKSYAGPIVGPDWVDPPRGGVIDRLRARRSWARARRAM